MLSLVITLIVIGILLWLVNQYIPMDAKIKKILNIVVVVIVVLWIIYLFFGASLGQLSSIPVPQIK